MRGARQGVRNGRLVASTDVATLARADATSGVDGTEYRLGGGLWQPYLGPFLVSADGSHTVEFRTTDVAGLVAPIQSVVFAVDTVPPTTTATLTGLSGERSWYVGSVTLILAAADATSGVATTEYRIDAGPWQAYGAPIITASDGTHVAEFRSTDVAGLGEAIGTLVFGIDTDAPKTTVSLLGQNAGDRFTSHVVVELSATDETSGAFLTEYRVDGGPWQPYEAAFRVASDGSHTVEFRSTDVAGIQETEDSASFRIDTNLVSPAGPVGPWLLVFIIAVIAGFALLVLLLVRKHRRQDIESEAPPEE